LAGKRGHNSLWHHAIQADYADKKTANGNMDDNVKNLGQLSLVINGLAT